MAKTKTTSKKTSTSNKKTTAPKTTQKKSASTRATAKTTPKTTKTTSKKQEPKKTTPAKKKDNYMLIKSGLDREGKQQYTAVKVHDKTPRGWKVIEGATTAPAGYKWVSNGKSALFGKRKTALVKE